MYNLNLWPSFLRFNSCTLYVRRCNLMVWPFIVDKEIVPWSFHVAFLTWSFWSPKNHTNIVGYWHFFFVGMGVPCPLVVILVSYRFLSLLDDDGPYVPLSLGEFPSPTQSMSRLNSFYHKDLWMFVSCWSDVPRNKGSLLIVLPCDDNGDCECYTFMKFSGSISLGGSNSYNICCLVLWTLLV